MNDLLINAVSNNDFATVHNLIQAGCDLTEKDEGNDSPLIIAVAGCYFEMTELLLDAGCNPNDTDKYGSPALMYAVKNENLEMAELLLKYGAKVNLKSSSGKTAYDLAKGKRFFWKRGSSITGVELPYWWKESEILKLLKKYKSIQDETNRAN